MQTHIGDTHIEVGSRTSCISDTICLCAIYIQSSVRPKRKFSLNSVDVDIMLKQAATTSGHRTTEAVPWYSYCNMSGYSA